LRKSSKTGATGSPTPIITSVDHSYARHRSDRHAASEFYEGRLVDSITQPGGARQKPLDKELNEFSANCKFLNSEIVASLLYKQFSIKGRCIKSLYVLEKLVRTYEGYQNYVKENRGAL
jgi:hypothetical protein